MSPIELQLLEKARNGLIRITSGNHIEVYYRNSWKRKIPNFRNGRAKFAFGHNRTSVYRNRLIFILNTLERIPEGYFVDHCDEDKRNDLPNNLRLMPISDSHKQGGEIRLRNSFNQVMNWFQHILDHGYPPCQ